MNQQFNNDEKAQVGIGTMIVFIATILVAAVAAGVLIDTSQKLQAKSTQTGNAATEQVGNMIQIQAIYGLEGDDDDLIDEIEIWVELAAGSEPMDLSELVIQYKTPTGISTFTYDSGAQDSDFDFVVLAAQETAPPTVDLADVILEAGELVKVHIGDIAEGGSAADLGLAAGSQVTIDLVPEAGATTSASFETPKAYGSNTYFELF